MRKRACIQTRFLGVRVWFLMFQQLTRRRECLCHCRYLRFKAPIHCGVGVRDRSNVESSYPEVDMVGPPDPVSNIRPIRLRRPTSEAEKEVHKLKLQMWSLKHEFWSQHNAQFKQEKNDFAESVLQRKRVSGELKDGDNVSQVTSEELSKFYKEFLDKKYADQMKFTRDWMRLNWLLTWTQFRYNLKKLFGALK